MSGWTLQRARIGASTGIVAVAVGALLIFAGGEALAAGTTWTVEKSPNATLSGGQLESVSCSSAHACTAVGKYLNPSGITDTLAERWDGSAWQKQPTPNPSGDTTSSVVPELLGVSCPTSGFCAAVGQYQTLSGSAIFAETGQAGQWTLQSVPVPDGAISPTLAQVSCTSATFCEAVGSYLDTNFNTDPLAAVWNGTSWSLQSTPTLTTEAAFTAVSCPSASFCEAWGGGTPNFPGPEVAEQWNGTSWQLQTVPSNAAAVDAVSCASASFCEAIATGAAYNWNGSQWSAQTLPTSLSSVGLNGVSCASRRFCEMVGATNVNGNSVLVAGVWNGSAWTAQTSPPNPAGATAADLNAVSCTAAKACEAVGVDQIQVTANDPKALAETWTGSSWTLQHAAAPAGAANNTLSSVSCVSASFCAAVGTHFNSAGDEVNLAEIWNGTSWQIKATPNVTSQSGAADNELYGVSCVSASFCQAVGAGPDGPTAELWNGTVWTVQSIPGADVQPQAVSCATADFCMEAGGSGDVDTWNGLSWSAGTSVTGFSFVGSLSCLSAGFCEAVGEGPSGENATAWNGTAWTAQATPGPVSNSFNSVSCNTATSCEAVGQALGSNGAPVPYADAWNGSTWTTQPAPAPANSQSSSLASVSCTSASSCTAVGQYSSSSIPTFGQTQTLAEVWDGTAWTIPATPDPSSTGPNLLAGVSCGASEVCMAVGQYEDPGEIPATLIELS
jgi:hypothetical protein